MITGFTTPHPDQCARTLGRSCRTCVCRLPGGGWLPCPPDVAQGLQSAPLSGPSSGVLALDPLVRLATETTLVVSETTLVLDARVSGYTGNVCAHCFSSRMRQAGTCEVCEDCGESGACG